MDVKRGICILESVRSFYLHQFHHMALNSEVNGSWKTHIWNSEPICLPWKQILTLMNLLFATNKSYCVHIHQWNYEQKLAANTAVHLHQHWMYIHSTLDRWLEARPEREDFDHGPDFVSKSRKGLETSFNRILKKCKINGNIVASKNEEQEKGKGNRHQIFME